MIVVVGLVSVVVTFVEQPLRDVGRHLCLGTSNERNLAGVQLCGDAIGRRAAVLTTALVRVAFDADDGERRKHARDSLDRLTFRETPAEKFQNIGHAAVRHVIVDVVPRLLVNDELRILDALDHLAVQIH